MQRFSTEKLAQLVKVKREEKGLTQGELGNMTGINRVTVGRIERGNFIPSINQLEALCQALEFQITELVVDEPETNSFIALSGEARTDSEREGVNQLFTMLLAMRQQFLLRRKFENEAHSTT